MHGRITHSVYRCKEEKMMSSELWALQSQPWWTQNHQLVWFGTVWGSGFAVRSQELVVVFVYEPVFQTSQVLFCFAQNREKTSVLIKRHVTKLKWKWWFCSNNLSLFFKHFTLNCHFDVFSPWFSWKSQVSCYLLSWASVGWHLPAHGRGIALTQHLPCIFAMYFGTSQCMSTE